MALPTQASEPESSWRKTRPNEGFEVVGVELLPYRLANTVHCALKARDWIVRALVMRVVRCKHQHVLRTALKEPANILAGER